jgi:hypothetical protein
LGNCDIEVEAIFAAGGDEALIPAFAELRASDVEFEGVANTFPWLDRLRFTPAQIADWRTRVRDGFESGAVIGSDDAADFAAGDSDEGKVLRVRSCSREKNSQAKQWVEFHGQNPNRRGDREQLFAVDED